VKREAEQSRIWDSRIDPGTLNGVLMHSNEKSPLQTPTSNSVSNYTISENENEEEKSQTHQSKRVVKISKIIETPSAVEFESEINAI